MNALMAFPGLAVRVRGTKFGRVLELVDRIDLGSIGVTPREGSSPSSPIVVSFSQDNSL